MKKILSLLVAVALVFSVGSLAAAAYTPRQDDAVISADDLFGVCGVYFNDTAVEVAKDDTVCVDLLVRNNVGFTELKVSVLCDAGLELTKVENGAMGAASLESGVITVANSTAITADTSVAKLTFKGVTEGLKNVRFNVSSAVNGADAVKVVGSDCALTVTAPKFLAGDVDHSGGDPDITDLAVLKKYLVDPSTVSDFVSESGDVDKSGDVDITDLALMKKYLAGVITSFVLAD